MQVKTIHFIPQCPGMPVYEMKDGALRIPFSQGGKDMYWLTESEVIQGAIASKNLDPKMTDKKTLARLRAPFEAARKAIGMKTVPMEVVADE